MSVNLNNIDFNDCHTLIAIVPGLLVLSEALMTACKKGESDSALSQKFAVLMDNIKELNEAAEKITDRPIYSIPFFEVLAELVIAGSEIQYSKPAVRTEFVAVRHAYIGIHRQIVALTEYAEQLSQCTTKDREPRLKETALVHFIV